MHSPSQTIPDALPKSRCDLKSTRRTEDVVYQIVTVAAILLVLGTLWVF